MRRLLLLSLLIAFSAPALAVYKCETNGKVSYGDEPCPGGKTPELSEALMSGPPPNNARGQKQQLSRDKNELRRIENERRRREAREEQERRTAARAHVSHQRKCVTLALRKKTADENAALAAGKTAARSRHKARHAAETYEAECANDLARPGLSFIGPRGR
jgi:hypothetical protein